MSARRRPANVRDLGGLPLVGGGATRHGVLLRGDASYADDLAPTGVPWPPAGVVDLRSPAEARRHPHVWPDTTVVVRHELYAAAALDSVPTEAGLIGVYEGILASASERVADVVAMIGAEGPTLVHCAAGKDRTGVVVAALLIVAGVEPPAVVDDYLRTESAMPEVVARLADRGGVDLSAVAPDWLTAPAQAVALVVELLTSWAGGPRQWFLDHGADAPEIDAWVERITGGGDGPVRR